MGKNLEKKTKSEEKLTRREFFRKSAKIILPPLIILGGSLLGYGEDNGSDSNLFDIPKRTLPSTDAERFKIIKNHAMKNKGDYNNFGKNPRYQTLYNSRSKQFLIKQTNFFENHLTSYEFYDNNLEGVFNGHDLFIVRKNEYNKSSNYFIELTYKFDPDKGLIVQERNSLEDGMRTSELPDNDQVARIHDINKKIREMYKGVCNHIISNSNL